MTKLDFNILLRSDARAIAHHLNDAVHVQGDEELSANILHAVQLECIPPTIIPTWLSVARTFTPVRDALVQDFSFFARRFATVRVSKILRTQQWQEMWDVLGDTEGLVALLAQMSVDGINDLTRAIGKSYKSHRSSQKEAKVEELFQSLSSSIFTDARLKNPDSRPLQAVYMHLLPGCSAEFVSHALEHIQINDLPAIPLLQSHTSLFQNLARQSLHGGRKLPADLFNPLLDSIPPKSSETGFSAPMTFTFSLLSDLVAQRRDPKVFPNGAFDTLISLLKKALKRKAPWDKVEAVIRLSFKYLDVFAKEKKQRQHMHSFLYIVAKCWSKSNEDRFGSLLDTLLEITQLPSDNILQTLQPFLVEVARAKRYRFLQLIIFHATKLDIDSTDALSTPTLGSWDTETFFMLRPDHASSLLERLIEARPEGNFIRISAGLLQASEFCSPSQQADPKMVLAYVHHGDQVAQQIAKTAIAECKQKAQKSRDQAPRGFYTRAVMLYAILSGSLATYKDALAWSKRFIRDPLTVKSICYDGDIRNTRLSSLLSGLPKAGYPLIHEIKQSHIQKRIDQANEILLYFFGFAAESLREPSFAPYHWKGLWWLFESVVEARMQRVPWLQKKLKLPDEAIYSAVWSSTLEMLTEVEKRALNPKYERLEFNNPIGSTQNARCDPRYRVQPTLTFIDNLARARDQLWKEYRLSIRPQCAVIPPPFPRGLPLGYLLPHCIWGNSYDLNVMPFLSERINAIVFMDPKQAMAPIPEDNETRAAIECFVDSYRYALELYANAGPTKEQKKTRYEQAWSYALSHLSPREFLTEQEAGLIWKERFKWVLSDVEAPAVSGTSYVDHSPHLPALDDADDLSEWNPQIDAMPSSKPKILPLTCLECFIKNDNLSDAVNKKFEEPPAIAVPNTTDYVWNTARLPKKDYVPGEIQDGYILSALLYLDSTKVSGTRQLAAPFPSTENVRYPALYLDATFLDSKNLNETSALLVLQEFIKRVPPTMIANLCRVEYQALLHLDPTALELAKCERITIGLLKLLAASDQPQLAGELIAQIVLDRPNASSWHRQLFTPGFIRSLSASDALKMIQMLTINILERLDEQAQRGRKRKIEDSNGDKPEKSIVKITTVKLLAQMLEQANFVSFEFSLRTLLSLYEKGNHIDVRSAVVDSLLTQLCACNDSWSSNTGKLIISALEIAVPILSAFNEAEPLSERDWQEAERTLTVPEPYGESPSDFPPVLAKFLSAIVPPQYQTDLVERILLRAVPQSKSNNRRWLRLVLEAHDADQNLAELSHPFTPQILARILNKHGKLLPVSVFREYHEWIMSQIRPSQALQSTTVYFKSTSSLTSSPEGKRWLALFDQGLGTAANAPFNMPLLLSKEWQQTQNSDGITISGLQTLVREQLFALLVSPLDSDHTFFSWLINDLSPPIHVHYNNTAIATAADRTAWLSNGKPLVEEIIAHIESLRTNQWQRNPNRNPTSLPKTFKWRTWLLPHPAFRTSNTPMDAACAAYAQAVRDLMAGVLGTQTTYHEELRELEQALRTGDYEIQLRAACYLGDLSAFDNQGSTLCLLCVELANGTFISAIFMGRNRIVNYEDMRARMNRVVESWKNCIVEDVREMGLQVSRHLEESQNG